MAAAKEKVSIGNSVVRSVYLITYSQADLEKFPNRSAFAKAVVTSFESGSSNVVKHWCCSQESHANGGQHYHLALKLNRSRRWLHSKRFLEENFGITVNYSSVHHNYYSAWQYVTKDDTEYEESPVHPHLNNAPKTTNASLAKTRNANNKREVQEPPQGGKKRTRKEKKKRLTALDVSDVILERNIKTITELHAYAQEQREQGKTDLVHFILSKQPKAVHDLINTTWLMKTAKETLDRAKKSRTDLLGEASKRQCVAGCNGAWLECANEILSNNSVDKGKFVEAVVRLLTKGRGKHRNLLIVGPANCGKTFILKPLTVLFRTFENPATGTFAWVGVEDAECIFVNDFRWSPTLIPWHDLLLMLEGEVVHLPAPKTHFTRDIELVKDTPIFCTSKRPLIYIKNGVVDDRESEMMAVRWHIIYFNHQIPQEQQRKIPACGRCFTELLSADIQV